MKPKNPPQKPAKFAARVGAQLMRIDRSTIALVAKVEDEIPSDIPDEMIAILCMRTMRRHLEMKLAQIDAMLGDESEHTITHVPKDPQVH